ncbi:MAG: hypothetical protein QG663_901 [Thermodesulfobacteriota bacterium]|nr:hypothetical protein [Thermodesulfobacteriota bacterium]
MVVQARTSRLTRSGALNFANMVICFNFHNTGCDDSGNMPDDSGTVKRSEV